MYTNQWPGQYLTHVHSCFPLIGAHWYSVLNCSHWANERGKPVSQRPFTAVANANSFFFVTLQYITIVTSIQDFFLPLEQLRMALLG